MRISKEEFLIADVPHLDDLKTKILSYREQEKICDGWLKDRFETVLPAVMKREGIDCWIVACKEYNEDPVLMTLVPKAMMTARRTTILMFVLKDEVVHRLALTRPGVGLDDYYEAAWTNRKGSDWAENSKILPKKTDSTVKGEPETQWECLTRLLKEWDPEKIGLDYSDTFAFGDGISHSMYKKVMEAIPDGWKDRVVSAENLCLGWMETRTEKEIAAYTGIMQIAHTMVAEAFSARVVIPGVTTNSDVKYWMMQKVIDLGLQPWFDFEVSITRANVGRMGDDETILPGDLLHCDVGLKYLGLCTDTQENAYVLKLGETDAPEYLKKALHDVNRFQDMVVESFAEGKTGNEILKEAREKAIAAGLKPCLYSHPIGYHGHGAGPTIGLWDMQGGVPVQGDYPMHDSTTYSIELNLMVNIEEWNTEFAFCLESDALFKEGKTHFLAGRQEEFHLIK